MSGAAVDGSRRSVPRVLRLPFPDHPFHAACGPDRLPVDRKIHALPAHDQRQRGASREWEKRDGIGISKVPDARLDRLTAMYNPRKHVPATIEFTDFVAAGKTGAAALVDVAGYKTADALVHVVRAFRDESVPHPAGSVDPARDAQAMEDELILADLGVVERRLERLEKDLKKSKSSELEQEKDLIVRCTDRARKWPAASLARARRR